jgi:glyceraldehyde-3-phosphate dehydrogenase/erythrose-4-phosphate dehydrogenase
VPTSTGAAKALSLVLPELEGKLTASRCGCRSPPGRQPTSP